MAELSNIASELSKGKNIDSNLSKYASGLASLYNREGYVKLALNLFSFAEIYGEDLVYTDLVKPAAEELVDIISSGITTTTEDVDSLIVRIDALRNQLITNMENLTAYADRFQIFEYILNRIEYNFHDCDVNLDYYDEKFEKDILNYIVSDKDNSVINMKISQVVAQLPMRLSKNKFFELLKQGFSIYNGSDVSAVDDYAYMIRSVAMLETPDNFTTAFPGLYDLYSELKGYDYSEMSEETFEAASDTLASASELVTSLTDIYVLIMESLNSAYTVLLANNALVDCDELNHCVSIINGALVAIKDKVLPTEENFEHFVSIEGVLEKVTLQVSKDGYALDDVRNSIMDKVEALDLTDTYQKLFKLEILNSGSNFMSLKDSQNKNVLADDAFIEQKSNSICDELAASFAENPRVFNRAVMAAILSQLPVFFNNLDEIKTYIHVALGQCKDEAEKKACMKLMLTLMND